MTRRRHRRVLVAGAAIVALAPLAVIEPATAGGAPATAPARGATASTLGPASSVPAPTARTRTSDAVDARIRRTVLARAKDPLLGPDVAVRVMDPWSRGIVASSRSTTGQIPASNAKLVTAFAALRVLGVDDAPRTRVTNGPLPGSVVLVGGGDPLLSAAALRRLADRTRSALAARSPVGTAPTRLTVYYDESLFPRHAPPRGWRSTYVPSEVNPVSPLQRWGARTSTPGLDAARTFADQLTASGTRTTVAGRWTVGARATVASLVGAPTQAAVERMLLWSDNNVAEVLARRAALATGRPASWDGWRRTANAVLRSAAVPMDGVRIVDGSGLSRDTRLPPATLAWLLVRSTLGSPDGAAGDRVRDPLVAALPVAGRSGTLGPRYLRYTTSPTSCAAGLVVAKTGSLSGVYALSGVAVAADGRPRVFSFLADRVPVGVRGLEVRRALDRLATSVVGCW